MFAVVPLSMGILGFIAAGTGFIPTDTGMVNFELIKAIFPAWVIIPFMFMPVSYTHLTLPTKRIVEISVVAASLKKKKTKNRIRNT